MVHEIPKTTYKDCVLYKTFGICAIKTGGASVDTPPAFNICNSVLVMAFYQVIYRMRLTMFGKENQGIILRNHIHARYEHPVDCL